jgi:DNA-directed RNA polymerase subunit H (RpoH/RPB5)
MMTTMSMNRPSIAQTANISQSIYYWRKMDNREVLYMVRRNQLRMVMDRGYNIGKQEAQLSWSRSQFLKGYKLVDEEAAMLKLSQLDSTYEKQTDRGLVKLHVAYISSGNAAKPSISKDKAAALAQTIRSMEGVSEVVLITFSPLSTDSRKIFANLRERRFVQIFPSEQLVYAAIDHIMGGTQELVSDEDLAAMATNGLVARLLPISLTTDPVVKWYGWREGQVIRVYNDDFFVDTIHPNSVNYRLIKDINE